MWRGIGALLLMLLLLSSNVCAQTDTLLYPLKNVPLLSGNFGELRATHLHTGLDFKTGGREGLPGICVKDGVVARVKVSATGYGNALYLEHEGGITTVYGHLSRFVPRIAKVVRNIQYNKDSRWMRICRAMNSVFVRETRLPIAGIPVLRVVLICILRCATRRVNML